MEPDASNFFLLVASATCGAVVPMLGPVSFGDFVTDPSSPTKWIAFALGAPTLVLLVLKNPQAKLGRLLQVLWSLSFAAYVVHLWSSAEPGYASSLNPLWLLGMPVSAILLASMWAVTVWSAWRQPDVIWPQAIILLVLGGSTIVTTILNEARPQRICGLAFTLALAAALVARFRQLNKDIEAITPRGPAGLCPIPPDITPVILAQQSLRDLQGKEVQCAATYSYLWFADQVGHFGLGMLLSLVLGEFAFDLVSWRELMNFFGRPAYDGPLSHTVSHFIGFAIATGMVCYWEVKAYRQAAQLPDTPFPVDRHLLFNNAVIAATYMVIGTLAGLALRLDHTYRLPMLVALAFLAVVAAKPWIRQKIIWQKAGLPYLFRLAEARHTILDSAAKSLQDMVTAAAPPCAPPQQVVLAGPIGSGRTLLASGIGTELAFCNKTVRYLSLDRLIEFASGPGAKSTPPVFGDDHGPINIDYWPWTAAQVLVIDDIGPVLGATEEKDLKALLETRLMPLRDCMANRHTVWIVGDLGSGNNAMKRLDSYGNVIRDFCKGRQDPTRVLLHLPGQKPEVHAPDGHVA
jgi:hypothetical protein